MLDLTGRLPDVVAACVGGGSNAIGIFHAFLDDPASGWSGFEAGGDGVETGRHAATITGGRPACCTAPGPTCCRTRTARPSSRTRSRPASTTPASAPSTPGCTTSAAPTYRPITDAEAMDAFSLLCRTEGIIPAIETAHALAGALRLGRELGPDAVILVNLSGRGDKDVDTAARWFGLLDDGPDPRAARLHRRLRRERGTSPSRRAREGRAALVGYLPAGFPTSPTSIAAMTAMVEGGVDVVEVGVPYSDPLMDGPVIQHAVEIALAGGSRPATPCARSRRSRRPARRRS